MAESVKTGCLRELTLSPRAGVAPTGLSCSLSCLPRRLRPGLTNSGPSGLELC